jgi:hypothetical protein
VARLADRLRWGIAIVSVVGAIAALILSPLPWPVAGAFVLIGAVSGALILSPIEPLQFAGFGVLLFAGSYGTDRAHEAYPNVEIPVWEPSVLALGSLLFVYFSPQVLRLLRRRSTDR